MLKIDVSDKTKYSLPEFVQHMQYHAVVILMHWHYFVKSHRVMHPMKVDWNNHKQTSDLVLTSNENTKHNVRLSPTQARFLQNACKSIADEGACSLASAPHSRTDTPDNNAEHELTQVFQNDDWDHPCFFLYQMYIPDWDRRETYPGYG